LGSNLGDRAANLRRGLSLLEGESLKVRRLSALYESRPLGVPPQPDFYNALAEVVTSLSPWGLLSRAKRIELEMGRLGSHREPRPLDIDIILYGARTVVSADLVVPHPRLWVRRFVLQPLLEMGFAPVRHDGLSAREAFASEAVARQAVTKVATPDEWFCRAAAVA